MSLCSRIVLALVALVPTFSVPLQAQLQATPVGVEVQPARYVGGRWVRIESRVTTVKARVFGDEGQALYVLTAQLIGARRDGNVCGVVREIAAGTTDSDAANAVFAEYLLQGRYLRLADGRVRIDALVALDLRPHGVSMIAVVGELHGLLQPDDGGTLFEDPSGTAAAQAADELASGPLGPGQPLLAPKPAGAKKQPQALSAKLQRRLEGLLRAGVLPIAERAEHAPEASDARGRFHARMSMY